MRARMAASESSSGWRGLAHAQKARSSRAAKALRTGLTGKMITYETVPRQVRLVLATRNAHKVTELARMLAGGPACESLDAFPGVEQIIDNVVVGD